MYYLSDHNLAMKNVLIWSLPSKVTCPKSTPLCRKHCYASQPELMWPHALPCRMENLENTKDRNFVDNMICVIRANVIKNKRFSGHFRIHESGDIYGQDYLDKWIAITKYLKGIKFLAFTKSSHLDYGNRPSNFEVIMSVWKDTKVIPKGFPIYYTGMKGDNSFQCMHGRDKCNKCGFKCWSLSKLKMNVWGNIH